MTIAAWRAMLGVCALVAALPAAAQVATPAGPTPATSRHDSVGGPSDTLASPRRKSPWVAGGLAYLFPGAGHFYAGEPRRAWLAIGLVGAGGMAFMSDATGREEWAVIGAAVSLGAYAVSIVDAPRAAARANRRSAAAGRGRSSGGIARE